MGRRSYKSTRKGRKAAAKHLGIPYKQWKSKKGWVQTKKKSKGLK